MNSLEALWLGIIQGLTEFLPVSSSGHLVLVQTLFGIDDGGGMLFEVAVHVATLLAIVIYFRAKIWELLRGLFSADRQALRYVAMLAIGTVPAVVVALGARDFLDEVLSSPSVAAAGLLATGCILWTTRKTLSRARALEPTFVAAFLIGIAQSFAILPGVSRSGTTVAAALALGIRSGPAAEFSFLLGVIAIAGAAVLTLPELSTASPEAISAVVLGCGAALVSGLVAIWLFVWLLKRETFYHFAWYTWAAGLFFSLWLFYS